MTRSPDQRLDRIEDEFETVKQLLTSAARYAESANEKLDRLSEKQDRTQTQLDQLAVRVDELTAAQAHTQTQLDQLSGRVDEFILQASRVFAQQGERMIRVEGLTESLTGVVQRLDRNYQAQQSQLQESQQSTQEFQRTTNAALERIDRILDYLLRQQGGG
jgi:ABC-type transporter Mla subunit MlaD